MYQELANALYHKKFVDGEFTQSTEAIFGENFRSHTQWQTFLSHNFGASASKIDTCIDKSKGWFTPEQFFQTLFVACWIYQPLEKGSYMIDFSYEQMDKICDKYFSKLKERKSSHLEGNNARSAGQGFNFLEGYHELLVQIPDTSSRSFMLKAEGHGALTVKHALGYFKKLRTGAGETANPSLSNLARHHQRFGIADRKAENYSKTYKSLIRYLELSTSRETVTFQEVLVAILKRKGYLKLSDSPDIAVVLPLLDKMLTDMVSIKVTEKKDLDYYLKMAHPDLTAISNELKKDEYRAKSPVPRFFNEVKGDTLALECALDVMKNALQNAK